MRRYFFPMLATGTVVMLLVMARTGATLITPATPNGILDLEFAYTAAQVDVVLQAWADNGTINNIVAAKIHTQLDFLFLLFYSAFLFTGCRKLALNYTRAGLNTGLVFANAALGAGLMDILENIGMLFTLHGYSHRGIPLATFIFSIAKWLMVLASLLYLIISGTLSMARTGRSDGKGS